MTTDEIAAEAALNALPEDATVYQLKRATAIIKSAIEKALPSHCPYCNASFRAAQASEPPNETPAEKKPANVLALGFKDSDGAITVTEVLCANFPPLAKSELAKLSWNIEQFCNRYRAAHASERDHLLHSATNAIYYCPACKTETMVSIWNRTLSKEEMDTLKKEAEGVTYPFLNTSEQKFQTAAEAAECPAVASERKHDFNKPL